SDEWILTAAHCVMELEPKSVLVAFTSSLGDALPDSPQEIEEFKNRDDVRSISEIHIHPLFIRTMNIFKEMVSQAEKEGRELTLKETESVTDWGDIALIRINGSIPSTKKPAR